jgi:hypothetical protein
MSHQSHTAPPLPRRSSTRHVGEFVEHDHGDYRSDHKSPEAATCRQCHASVHNGSWQWLKTPTVSAEILCPACQRIRDDFPAGFVSIEGDFFQKHRVELMYMVQTQSTRATAADPLRRLMRAHDTPGGVMFTTTDTHLAMEIGDALHDAFGGHIRFSFADGHELLRVHWKR